MSHLTHMTILSFLRVATAHLGEIFTSRWLSSNPRSSPASPFLRWRCREKARRNILSKYTELYCQFRCLVEPAGLARLQAQKAAEMAGGYSRPLILYGRASNPRAHAPTKSPPRTFRPHQGATSSCRRIDQ
ncbi:hypothetical protein EDB81DRAFT_273633 [Dactylonectria macrodidyma]|uniref:Secreted protein n=1 Tax=Dactylonectria macrodidyma TaxID=307937 RepID=A0A9P9JFK6_9HYPO|nr:hypothetical protein EDB81DRAFT_273633 [Dactylonectria macrodidyma]